MMKKLVCILFICLSILHCMSAKGKDGHDADLHEVLFGEDYDKCDMQIRQDKIEKLDAACYLLLDYCKMTPTEDSGTLGEKCLRKLEIYNIRLEQIETPGGPHHERYTHLGWDEMWYHGGENAVNAFKLRRDGIMVESVYTKIFNDSSISRRQAVLFSKLCYYVHILGDHEHNTPTTAGDLMMLVHRPNVKKQTTVLDELISICTELFLFQDDTYILTGKLRGIRDSTRPINDSNEAGKNRIRVVATKVLEVLKANVPDLLRDWEPFVENFYEKDYYQDQEDLLAS